MTPSYSALPSEVFRERLRTLREKRGVSQQGLVRRLRKLGVPMHQPGIARIEAGERKVSLDEAVAISAALKVLPEVLYRAHPDWEDYSRMQAEQGPDEEPLTPADAWLRVWTDERQKQEQSNAPAARQRSGADTGGSDSRATSG